MTKLLNVNDAADLLSISPWTVRAYIREGKLRSVRLGRRVLLSETELERLINESQSPSGNGTPAGNPTEEVSQ